MARNTEFYKGRRKKRNRILIPTAIVLGLISLAVVLFYGMQKYVVISKEEVAVVLPIMGENGAPFGAEDNTAAELETTEVRIAFEEPDYSGVEAVTGEGLEPIRAIFVPAEEINAEKLTEYAARLNVGNALVLEMKPRSGALVWDSKAAAALSYGLAGSPLPEDVQRELAKLKEEGVYLAAQISVCRDELFAARSTIVTLKTTAGGNYTDEGGTWLDAYSVDVRNYTVELARELWALGFDEVILADVAHPVLPEDTEVSYTREMSTKPSAVGAVCGFATYVAGELADRKGLLSIYVSSAPSLVRADGSNGQDGPLFFKIYDRVYYATDRYAYTFNVDDVRRSVTIGEVNSRFVPVVQNYLPDNSGEISWVLIDTESN